MPQQKVSQEKEGRTGHESLAGHLTAPLMDFNLAKEIEQLHEEEAWLRTGRNSKTRRERNPADHFLAACR